MAQSGFTPIQLYRTATASAAPSAGNLADGELAINTNDGRLFYKDSGGAVQTIAWRIVPISAGGTGATTASGALTNLGAVAKAGDTMTGALAFVAGTVSAPGLTFTGDTNTGIYSPAADTIAFTEGGVEAMRLDASGNVGIGTSSPRARSNVNGGSGAPSLSADTNNIALTTSSTSVELAEGAYPGSPFAYWMQVKQTTNSGAAWPLVLQPIGGDVGIGTSAPLTGLQVSRGASEPVTETGTLLVTGSTTAFRLAMGYSSASNAGWVQSVQNTVNSTPLLLNPLGGNVGIGTSSPTGRLSVTNGDDARVKIFSNGGSVGVIDAVANTNDATGRWLSINPTGGNVGIGTSGPTAPLTVKTRSADNLALRVLENAGSGIIQFTDDPVTAERGRLQATSTGNVRLYGASTAEIYTAGSERMRIDASGNVGIGTASPASRLDVSGVIRDSKGDVRSIPQNAQTSAYTLVANDAGRHISITTGGVTVPASVFSIGDAVTIFNNSGSNQTITQGASVTLRQAGTASTGNRTLAQYGVCTILCVASNTFVISGAGLT